MIEAELKARLRDPDAVRAALDAHPQGMMPRTQTYQDTYYDRPDGRLDADGRELRVRVITDETGIRAGQRRRLLTYKDQSTHTSGSKPEYETLVADADATGGILRGLGYLPSVRLTKHCTNYELSAGGRDLLATLVTVPELDGTYLEVETLADEAELDAALDVVRQVLAELGVTDAELTDELYTDAVKAARSL